MDPLSPSPPTTCAILSTPFKNLNNPLDTFPSISHTSPMLAEGEELNQTTTPAPATPRGAAPGVGSSTSPKGEVGGAAEAGVGAPASSLSSSGYCELNPT